MNQHIETILLKHADAINNKSVSLRELLEEAYVAGKLDAIADQNRQLLDLLEKTNK